MVALTKTSSNSFLSLVSDRDLLEELLESPYKPSTKRAYETGLKSFFRHISGKQPSPQLIEEFLQLDRPTALRLVLHYKAELYKQGKKTSTVNLRISAIKALVAYAQKVDRCVWSLEEIKLDKVKSYRDTAGVSKDEFKKLFKIPDRNTLKGKRDYAILRLLWDNVLRRSEICSTNVEDFDPTTGTLYILGKGKNEKEPIKLSKQGVDAISTWLEARGKVKPKDPLFIAVDRAHKGHRLTGDGLYHLVRHQLAEKAEFKKIFSPHRCRHSGTTASLEENNGNVLATKQLTRHAKTDTVLMYFDNLKAAQSQATTALADLMDD